MNNTKKKQNRGKKSKKSFAFFIEYKFYLVIAVAITFIFFIGTARSGTFFGLTLNVNTTLENDLVGHWTLDGKNTISSTVTDRMGTKNGTLNGYTKTVSTTYVQSASYSAADTQMRGMRFNNDGTKLFIAGDDGNDINQYPLSSAFDISTLSPGGLSVFSIAAQDIAPKGLTFNNDGTKMYVVGQTNTAIFEYTLATAFTVTTATYSTSASVSAQDPSPRGISFNTSGTKLFMVGLGNDRVYEYTLSTPFDISTMTFSQNFSVSAQDLNPTDVVFNKEGTKMFISGNQGNDVNEYTLTAGFDISTASFVDSFSISSQDGSPLNVAFNTAGSKMFFAGNDNQNIYEYTLNEGFDVAGTITRASFSPGRLGSALSFDGSNDYVGIGATGQTVKTLAFWMKADSLTENIIDLNGTADVTVSAGTISANSFTSPTIYVDGEVGSVVDTGWRHVVITTATGISASNMDIGRANGGYFDGAIDDVRIYNRVLSVTEITRLAQLGMTTKIGTTIYSNPELESGLLGHWTLDGKDTTDATTTDRVASNDGVYSGNTVIATTTYLINLDIGIQETQPQEVVFNNNGTKMYIAGNNGNDITEYSLSVAYDITSTVTFLTNYSVVSEITNPSGLAFNNDGTKMFITGYLANAAFEYTISSAFDLSSIVTFVSSTSVQVNNAGPSGIIFNDNGTKMFIISSTADFVGEYALSSPFDLSSVSYTTKFDTSGQETAVNGIIFNENGTKMLLLGDAGNDINEYTLSTGFDLTSTLTFIDNFSVASEDLAPKGMTVNSAGTKLYMIGDDSNDIFEYTLTEAYDLGGIILTSKSTPGRLGSAMEFDGIDDYIDISGVAASIDETQGTLAAWIYIDPTVVLGTKYGILELGDANSGDSDIALRIGTGGAIGIRYEVGGVITQPTTDALALAGTWVHVTGTWDTDNSVKLYINGVQSGSTQTRSADIANGLLDQSTIGADSELVIGASFLGKIDDARIYNRALPPDEILRLAQLGMTTRIGVTPPANPTTQGDLIGHWTFDGKYVQGTTTANSSVGTAHGTIFGTNISISTPGKIGSAFKFDGIDDYVDISGVEASASETQGTIAAWVYYPSSEVNGTNKGIVEIGDASIGDNYIALRMQSDNNLSLRYNAGGTTKSSVVSASDYADQWVHLLGTWDSNGDHALYINGSLVTGPSARSATISGGLLDQAFIGVDAEASPGNYFKGKIDDVRIYSKALSTEEVQRLYEQGT